MTLPPTWRQTQPYLAQRGAWMDLILISRTDNWNTCRPVRRSVRSFLLGPGDLDVYGAFSRRNDCGSAFEEKGCYILNSRPTRHVSVFFFLFFYPRLWGVLGLV